MDIFIDCGDFGVAIENKIYAGDQERQLKRYNEFLVEKKFKKYYLVYLTLYGDEASEQSGGNIKYKCLSYKYDIFKWLELCQKEVYNKPIIRETLEQYINLIKILTSQTRSKNMSNEIVETVIKSPENVRAAIEIVENEAEVKREIVRKWFVPAMEGLAKKHNLTSTVEGIDCLQQFWSISLKNERLEKHHIQIRFQFEYSNLKRLGYGFVVFANNDTEAKGIFDAEDALRTYLAKSNLGDHPSPPWWLFNEILYPGKWGSDELLDLVSEESKVVKKCEEKIISLLDCINGFKL
jgi:hypothetical protein